MPEQSSAKADKRAMLRFVSGFCLHKRGVKHLAEDSGRLKSVFQTAFLQFAAFAYARQPVTLSHSLSAPKHGSDGLFPISDQNMHYFSIHTPSGEHVGFLIMLPDDETEQPPQSGRFTVKLQSETPPQDAAARALAPYQSTDTPFYWAVEKDHVALFDSQTGIGRIRNEYLSIGGQTLLLNDLTGSL